MRSISVLAIVFILVSCEKDKFTTTPQLKYKSTNSKQISGTQVLEMKLDLTDKEADFSTFLVVQKTVRGCPSSNFTDSTLFGIPGSFLSSKQRQGELVITLDRTKRGTNSCFLPGNMVRPDTSTFSFWTRDKAGHVSDTAYSDEIIIMP
jgi:hypothetical protein